MTVAAAMQTTRLLWTFPTTKSTYLHQVNNVTSYGQSMGKAVYHPQKPRYKGLAPIAAPLRRRFHRSHATERDGCPYAGRPTVWANSTRCSGRSLNSLAVFSLSQLWNQAAKPCEAANR